MLEAGNLVAGDRVGSEPVVGEFFFGLSFHIFCLAITPSIRQKNAHAASPYFAERWLRTIKSTQRKNSIRHEQLKR